MTPRVTTGGFAFGDYVSFQTAGRSGLSAPMRGVVHEIRTTARGFYYGIRMEDGSVVATRAARMSRVRGRRPAFAS